MTDQTPTQPAPHSLASRGARVLFALSLLALPACHQQMAVQPSPRPLEASDFFADGRSSRPPVAGTVARGQLRTNRALFEGVQKNANTKADEPVAEFPFEMTEKVLRRGKQRFDVFCAVCHGSKGWGDGRIQQRGFTRPTSLLYEVSDRWVLTAQDGNPLTAKDRTFTINELAEARRAGVAPVPALLRGYKLKGEKMTVTDVPVGYIFQVITKGYGAMPDYNEQIPVNDRWAIAGYVKALQYSQMPEVREKKPAPKGEKK